MIKNRILVRNLAFIVGIAILPFSVQNSAAQGLFQRFKEKRGVKREARPTQGQSEKEDSSERSIVGSWGVAQTPWIAAVSFYSNGVTTQTLDDGKELTSYNSTWSVRDNLLRFKSGVAFRIVSSDAEMMKLEYVGENPPQGVEKNTTYYRFSSRPQDNHQKVLRWFREKLNGTPDEIDRSWIQLSKSINGRDPDAWRYVTSKNANIPLNPQNDWYPIHHAARYGDRKLAVALVEHGADVSVVARAGGQGTPAQLALKWGNRPLSAYFAELNGENYEAMAADDRAALKEMDAIAAAMQSLMLKAGRELHRKSVEQNYNNGHSDATHLWKAMHDQGLAN